MLHQTITSDYDSQKRAFKKLVSSLFGLAGIYWLVIYGLGWAEIATAKDVTALRGGQSIIYFVLLTIWGVEYLRETKRLKLIIEIANSTSASPAEISADQITDYSSKFAILSGSFKNKRSLLFPGINIAALIFSAVAILMQYTKALFLLIS